MPMPVSNIPAPCFNEAGPQGAGNGAARAAGPDRLAARFNEAGPQGAGNGRPPSSELRGLRAASMRPARKGPETDRPGGRVGDRAHRFNEAGPQGAGNGTGAPVSGSVRAGLQ